MGTSSQDTERKEEVAKLLQPALITGAVLRDYQLYGVNWITSLYENGRSCFELLLCVEPSYHVQ